MAAIVTASGMVTGVGLNAAATCAAVRGGISGYVETPFTVAGEWLMGCPVPLPESWRGRSRLVAMAATAIRECVSAAGLNETSDLALVLCISETERVGRFDELDESLLSDLEIECNLKFHAASSVIAKGTVGGVDALSHARRLLAGRHPRVLVVGVDSLLVAGTIEDLSDRNRLLTESNSDGFVPGEGAAAVMIEAVPASNSICLDLRGVGIAEERATVESGEPLRGDGMVSAFQAALAEAGVMIGDLDYRITDLSGEQYGFKEATLALDRILRGRIELFDIWHPAECYGHIGAATVPALLGIALAAARKGYAPGPGVLIHAANDNVRRGALVLSRTNGSAV